MDVVSGGGPNAAEGEKLAKKKEDTPLRGLGPPLGLRPAQKGSPRDEIPGSHLGQVVRPAVGRQEQPTPQKESFGWDWLDGLASARPARLGPPRTMKKSAIPAPGKEEASLKGQARPLGWDWLSRPEARPLSLKDKILAAAAQEFAAKGFHGARMQVIAARAGCNKALAHYYFKDKAHLYRAALVAGAEKVINLLAEATSAALLPGPLAQKSGRAGPREAARRLIGEMLTLSAAHAETLSLVWRAALEDDPPLKKAFVEAKKTLPAKRTAFLTGLSEIFGKAMGQAQAPEHLWLSLLGLCVASLFGRQIAEAIFEVDMGRDQDYLTARKRAIAALLDLAPDRVKS